MCCTAGTRVIFTAPKGAWPASAPAPAPNGALPPPPPPQGTLPPPLPQGLPPQQSAAAAAPQLLTCCSTSSSATANATPLANPSTPGGPAAKTPAPAAPAPAKTSKPKNVAQTPAESTAPVKKGRKPGKRKRASKARQGNLVIGDSLTVGAAPYLRKGAAARRTKVNALGGRTLAQGMAEYDKAKNKPKVVSMGLFTNDDPANVRELESAVRKTIADARKRGGRVVWATIERPPLNGRSYAAANRLLRKLARENKDVMGLVDWQKAVAKNPGFLASDKIHATPAGYRHRARLFTQAARAN